MNKKFITSCIFMLFFCNDWIWAQEKKLPSFSSLVEKVIQSPAGEGSKGTAEILFENYPKRIKDFQKSLLSEREKREEKYTDQLSSYILKEYLKKLSSLTQEDVNFIVALKILWEPYLKYRGNRIDFKNRYLKPLKKVKKLLLPDIYDIKYNTISDEREKLLELALLIEKCDEKLGVSADPTVELKTPTGIPYTSLDTPQRYKDYLYLLERTLVLINTVAPKEADKLLLQNVENSKILDVYEAEFTYFANEVRMLMGTIAWVADPLLSNCARDHSHDRKNGKAKGHSSTIPGKKSFVDRARRMGTSTRSEGAGGGKTGVDAIMGLSYGGGHTGPLYSTLRNVVGVGVRQGACTAMYRGDETLKHTAPAIDNFNFMPPGFSYKELKSDSSQSASYKQFQKGEYHKVLTRLENFRPVKSMDPVYALWFKAYAELKLKNLVQELSDLLKAGDYYLAGELYDELRKKYSGNKVYEQEIEPLKEILAGNEFRNEYRIGKTFYKYAKSKRLNEKSMARFLKSYPESIYSEVAKSVIQNIKNPVRKFHFFKFFLNKNKALYDFGYPECLMEKL